MHTSVSTTLRLTIACPSDGCSARREADWRRNNDGSLLAKSATIPSPYLRWSSTAFWMCFCVEMLVITVSVCHQCLEVRDSSQHDTACVAMNSTDRTSIHVSHHTDSPRDTSDRTGSLHASSRFTHSRPDGLNQQQNRTQSSSVRRTRTSAAPTMYLPSTGPAALSSARCCSLQADSAIQVAIFDRGGVANSS